jgi:glycosyltransferase involved in cell wall biosynthesis
MKIAVVFEGDLQIGGGFQQQLSTMISLGKSGKFCVIAIVGSSSNKVLFESQNIKTIVYRPSIFDRVRRAIFRFDFMFPIVAKWRLHCQLEKSLIDEGVDIVYFLSPSKMALDFVTLNYIVTVWDLCHRDTPEFPEVRDYREFEMRDNYYFKVLPKALAVIVDSDLVKKNLVRRYSVDEDRVFPVSFAPSENVTVNSVIDIRMKYGVQGPYIYYPAQLWAHKNHAYILDALAELKKRNQIIHAIFSGSNKGNLDYILKLAITLGVRDQISYIGFAPNEDIQPLYLNALALVMPSYFGPTNIPPLEAFLIGVPVICSDLIGAREQLLDAALYCNLDKPTSLAEHLENLLLNPDRREQFVEKGRMRLKDLQSQSVTVVLEHILNDFKVKLRTWKS